MTMTQANSTYHVPQTPEDSLITPAVEQEATVEIRPIEPGEALEQYHSLNRELAEEASRLAIAATPLFAETVQEFAARPGPEAPPLLRKLSSIGREFAQLRRAKVSEIAEELTKLKQITRYRGANGELLYAKILADLIEEEGLIGGTVFGDPTKIPGIGPEAKNEEWSFYYENANGQDEYFFTRRQPGAKEPYMVLRYVIEPQVIRKTASMEINGVKDGGSAIVQPAEAGILEYVAEESLSRVKAKLHTNPARR